MFKIQKLSFVALIVAVFLIGGICGGILVGTLPPGLRGGPGADTGVGTGAQGDSDASVSDESVARVRQLAKYLEDNFYKPITSGAIETGLLRGLFLSPGDPYTVYYTQAEFEKTMEATHGEMSGVGITLTRNDDGFIEIISVIEGSPASEAGLMGGDLLLSVDGKRYTGEQLTEAVEAARGEPGVAVVIGISRDGREKDYTIKRSVFVAPTVVHEIMANASGDAVGYIGVASFNDNTSVDFESALKEMNEGGVKGIVIDVRNNAGGLVDKAVEMDDMLLDKGLICYAEDARGERIEYATEDGRTTDLPYAVLIDETSVSAAEIFALGIKAEGGGKLVGGTTFGKGLIQKLEKFEAGDGVRITIMQYVTPDGDPVNGVGIAPDIPVEQPEGAKPGTPSDAQLSKALALF
ncbi:MAG: S41 family peptidase [Clostridiales Family XIII bacterium]|jgi:carboxyl-terminal processing protease|nr:S41 family peptidase [Clostridiales Family XIII bacterium]